MKTAEQPAASIAFTRQLRNTVGFLSVTFTQDAKLQTIQGTCFFVWVPDARWGDGKGLTYLVTNRHMAEPRIETGEIYPVQNVRLRLNLRSPQNGAESVEEKVPMGGTTRWFIPKDDAVDLAILPLDPDPNKYEYRTIPSSAFATPDQIQNQGIAEGDSVVFAGYFYQFPGQNRIEPIVREGVLAMMPDEQLNTTLQKPGRLYFAEAHAFHGNSGSPLFVSTGGFRHGAAILSESYLLIGIISGYYPEGETFSVPAATVLTGEVHDNSGIATVVPVEELSKLLNSPEVLADRDARVREFTNHR